MAQSLTTGPDHAVIPQQDWVSIEPGAEVWYVFKYDFDQMDEAGPSQALVRLESNVEDSVSFKVWTPNDVHSWQDGLTEFQDFQPTGVGSKLSNDTGRDAHDKVLVWATGSEASETFYVIVKNERDTASYYQLTVRGDDVSFPAIESEAPTMAAEAVTAEPVAMSEPEMTASANLAQTAGSGPYDARAVSVDTAQLDPGETRWYTFEYDYDNSDDAGLPEEALVMLQMLAGDDFEFEVWTPAEVQHWINGTDDDQWDAVGVGSKLSGDTGETADEHTLIWAGSNAASDTYYIIVENHGEQPGEYSLTISGPTISF
jgi:hypothetical protein